MLALRWARLYCGCTVAVPPLYLRCTSAPNILKVQPLLYLRCTLLDMQDLKRVLLYLMLDMLDLGCSG